MGRRPPFPDPRQTRHEFISGLHVLLKPRTYLEIGVEDGFGLALSSATTIGVDPEFHVTREVRAPLQLVRATSDEFFARPDPTEFFGGHPVDLAFIDGMHLAEFAYRDLLNVERFAAPGTVVVFDDVLPRSVDEAARVRHTEEWAGDLFKLPGILRELRPDLGLLLVNTEPTGMLVVLGLDPSSTALAEAYESVAGRLVAADPQEVPDAVLQRHDAADALDVLWWAGWPEVVAAREAGDRTRSGRAAARLNADF